MSVRRGPLALVYVKLARRGLALGLCLLHMACITWEPVSVSTPAPVRVGITRVLQSDGAELRLSRTRVSADSVVGRKALLLTTRRVAIPTDRVVSVERARVEWLRSAGLVVLMLAGTALSTVFAPPMQ